MTIQEVQLIFNNLSTTQMRINRSHNRSMSTRFTTDNFFQVTIFFNGVSETVWNIDSVEKMNKFYTKCKSID